MKPFKVVKLGAWGSWEDCTDCAKREAKLMLGRFEIGRLVECDCREGHLWGKRKAFYLSMPFRQSSHVYSTPSEALRCVLQ